MLRLRTPQAKIDDMISKYDGKANIPGFIGNIRIFTHYTGTDARKMNDIMPAKFEAEMAIEVCQHLIWNNLKPEEIQMISNLGRRLSSIMKKAEKAGNQTVRSIPTRLANIPTERYRVTVVIIVDSTDWDEEEMFRAIAVAIEKSSDGVIVICHFAVIMQPRNRDWMELINRLYQVGSLAPYLPICCEIHKNTLIVASPEEFRLNSPKGGCLEICNEKFCDHPCTSVCYPTDIQHEDELYSCWFRCEMRCTNGHHCRNRCSEKCRCGKRCEFRKVCGHPADEHSNMVCFRPCEEQLPCGHPCDKLCHRNVNPNHEEITCIQRCDKKCDRGAHTCGGNAGHFCGTPCSPCRLEFRFQLPCRHEVEINCCDKDPNLDSYVCMKKCLRDYDFCYHPCDKLCYEDCGVCDKPYPRKHPVCGHIIKAPCHAPITVLCKTLVVSPVHSRCGHIVKIPCYTAGNMSADSLAQYCFKKCDKMLNMKKRDCGHFCYGNCWQCHQGQFHQRCTTTCGKVLICGHECKVACPQVCPPCNQKCMMTVCEHYECPYECGVPCEYECDEPCNYECPHLKCSMLCGEVCDRAGCKEPCSNKLECGHPCVGFCGEMCPKLCRICNHDELLQGTFTGATTIEEDDRFIYLKNCGHSIEEYSLEGWINTTIEGGEIHFKCCPICRKQITGLCRFSKTLLANWKDVAQVKKAIFGNINLIMEVVFAMKLKVKMRMDQNRPRAIFRTFGNLLISELSIAILSDDIEGEYCNLMYQDRVRFIDGLVTVWETAEDQMQIAMHTWPHLYVSRYQEMYTKLLDRIASRNWPLHPNEISSINREMRRLKDAGSLYRRLGSDVEPHTRKLAYTREARDRFEEAEQALQTWNSYDKNVRRGFKESFKEFTAVTKYTLEISEQERHDIIGAFGDRTGRWFKCPNGHVYVVTECGGATQLGTCNECGAVIGGVNHAILHGNQLATEMDGAQEPMYPTALVRHYFP